MDMLRILVPPQHRVFLCSQGLLGLRKKKKIRVKHRDARLEGVVCFRLARICIRRGFHIKVFDIWNNWHRKEMAISKARVC